MQERDKFRREDLPGYPPQVDDYFKAMEDAGLDPYDPDQTRHPRYSRDQNAGKKLDEALNKLHKEWKKKRMK
jgi:hypothetical protein